MIGAWAALAPFRARVLTFLVAGLLATGAAAAGDGGLSGDWHGPITTNGLGSAKGEARLSLEADGDTFAARWTGVDGGEASGRFQPTSRPGVLAPTAGGFKSMFGSKAPEPFKGDELVWARRGEEAVYIYRLKIADDGGFALDRYAFEAKGDAMSLSVQRSGPDGIVAGAMSADLRREGG